MRWFKRKNKAPLDETLSTALGQQLGDIDPPAEAAESLRAKVLEHARQPQADARGLVTIPAHAGTWRWFAPGIQVKDLYTDPLARSRSFLLKMEPGARLPAHAHTADEECVVLEGELSMGDLTIGAGSYHLAPAGIPHLPIISGPGALLFLRSGLSDELSPAARMLQNTVQMIRGDR